METNILTVKYKISFLVSDHMKKINKINEIMNQLDSTKNNKILNESTIKNSTCNEIRNCSIKRLDEILLFFTSNKSKTEIIKFQKYIISYQIKNKKKVRFSGI